MKRDKNQVEELNKAGWSVLTIWECETNDQDSLTHKIVEFLNERRA
jgi:DNA mismatch endonuclease (patch repair protein)